MLNVAKSFSWASVQISVHRRLFLPQTSRYPSPQRTGTMGWEADQSEPPKSMFESVREDTSEGSTSGGFSSERDEVQEVRKASSVDTRQVYVWRFIATAVLLVTAVIVTSTTYYFLQRQHTDNFESQFEQFSQSVADTALDHQRQARLAYRGFADAVTSNSRQDASTGSWPNFILPDFESYAGHLREQSNSEMVFLCHVVPQNQRDSWLNFTHTTYEETVDQRHMFRYGHTNRLIPVGYHPYMVTSGFVPDTERDTYFPMYDVSPPPLTYLFINWNIASDPETGALFDDLIEMKTELLISSVFPYSDIGHNVYTEAEHEQIHKNVLLADSSSESPHSWIFLPIHERLEDPEAPIVAVVGGSIAWDFFMTGLLPNGVNGITVILENSCGQVYTYEINGPNVRLIGEGDHHEREYHDMETYQDLTEGLHTHPQYNELTGHCRFALRIYPTSVFEESLDPFVPVIFAIVVASTFVMVAVVFYVYDTFVQRRNERLVAKAAQSNAIVSSMFPSNIRDRLMNPTHMSAPDKKEQKGGNLKGAIGGLGVPGLSGEEDSSKPLADLFLECSVLFADFAGFTAWSSVREPTQVFTILEKVFGEFDRIAKIRRVFKVETVGDCYVAASGIPDFKKDHAVMLVRFARDILAKMNVLTKELETTLGPDTGELSLRVGIHSGPVTAGVLRGERARFQLFGDTMNMCSRVENSGMAGRIHVSTETAEYLKRNGKSHWLVKREDRIEAKGKGTFQTYWIGTGVERDKKDGSVSGSSCMDREHLDDVYEPNKRVQSNDDAKVKRLVDWNVQMLSDILRHIIAQRNARKPDSQTLDTMDFGLVKNDTTFNPLDDVEDIIRLPEFDAEAARRQEDPENIVINQQVTDQLRHYVQTIASMYRENSFHNFEHASHVTMSVIKLLSRIVAPAEVFGEESNVADKGNLHASLHDHTYGITSDPLTQFSCAFAAMIHDVDHVGVPNVQLVKEKTRIAEVYRNTSVAEQNSLVLAWDLLLSGEYNDLRSTICSNQSELERFRQLVVNAVMATDIADKNLKVLRNARWDKAFKDSEKEEDERTAVNRKATIVIEHLIQASDVAHTMQHWHVYRKWNENFFRECYSAYVDGRAEQDPTETWYKGEIGFFDFYIIPLARKLKECGVFGKSSDEYLTYAMANRHEWEQRGEEIVAEMAESVHQSK